MSDPGAPTGGVLNSRTRSEALAVLASGELDLLVVGGGITGAGAALDAATRGLRVALVEATDLGAGTSSKSSKLIHGGLRYLEMGDLGLVREALRERELLLTRLAPHLVSPAPFLWPLRRPALERAYLGAGLVLYDTLGGRRSVPRHRHLSRRGVLAAAPALSGDGVVGGVQFYDAAEDDARMAMIVARTAAARGAAVATRMRVDSLYVRSGCVVGAELIDELTGESLPCRPRHVVLAAGPWGDALRDRSGLPSEYRLVPSKGVHLTVARDRIPMTTGVLSRTEKSVLFIIPTEDGWVIGDTDTAWRHDPALPVASGADVDYLLAKANALLTRPLRREDVRGVFAGIRPLAAPVATAGGSGAVDTTRVSRRHVIDGSVPGLTSIGGGKYTTYRVMAADLIDAATRTLGIGRPSVTARVPLLGAQRFRELWSARAGLAASSVLEVATIERLLRRYGDAATELLDLVAARPELREPLDGGLGHVGAEVVYACTHEGALTLADVLERRTRLAIMAPDRGLAAAETAAALMAAQLDWSEARTRAELDRFRSLVAAQRAGERQPDDAAALSAYRAALAAAPARVAR
jgi:glycerol-3-phosphate dehydrogenase